MNRKSATRAFAAALASAALFLVCCGRDPVPCPSVTDIAGTDSGAGETEEETTDYIPFSGFSGYTVIMPDRASDTVGAAARETANAIAPLSGFQAVLSEKDSPGRDIPEILVGNLRRPESAELQIKLKNSEKGRWYHIGCAGDKIFILGSDDDALFCGARYFASRICGAGEKEQNVMIPESRTFQYDGVSPSVISVNEKNRASVFAAEVNLAEQPWFADTDGTHDMSGVIQRALDYARSLGGGIVFLPAGKYLVTEPLRIETSVTLRGACSDPDEDGAGEGTTLIFSFKGAKKRENAMTLSENAALQGITVLYEGQDMKTPFGFTVSGEGNAITIKDCVFLNSWNGISSGKKPVGMVTIENVRGTVLHTGIEAEQHADICVMTDVIFSPSYWAKNGGPAEEDIRSAMKENGSVGMYLGDVDRDTYENVLLDGFETGIYNREATRAGCSGSFYGLRILNSRTGVEAHGLSPAYGICVACGEIRASGTAILNATTDGARSIVNTANLELTGSVSGRINAIFDERAVSAAAGKPREVPQAPANLFNVIRYGADRNGKKDISGPLQDALDAAEAAGGGVVYIPAGLYLLEKPVSGGKNVCIQGAHPGAQGATSDFSGSVLLVKHGKNLGQDGQAAITLSGDNSGVTGVTVYYPENGIYNDMKGKTVSSCSPFLRCTGKNSYFTFSCLVAVSRAVSFEGADGFIADRLTGTFYDCGIYAENCSGGLVTRIHTNGTYLAGDKKNKSVLGSDWFNDMSRLGEAVLEGVLGKRLVQVSASGCSGLSVSHTFYYGGRRLVCAENSDLSVLCCEGARSSGESFVLNGGCSLSVVISNRPNGNPYIKKTGENNRAYIIMMNNSLTVYSGNA